MFYYGQDFGEGKVYEGSPFLFFEIEPRIQINFGGSNANYIAFAYNFGRSYVGAYEGWDGDPIRQLQWINLRFCLQL
jgi:hypothetical protein